MSIFTRTDALALRRDRLMLAKDSVLGGAEISDDYLLEKLKAAEADASRTLRVFFEPTRLFPQQPTLEQIAALAGMPWEVESAPDYTPDMFERDKWGYIVTRQRPIVSIEGMRWVYPTETNGFYDIPLEWLSVDKKYGHIRVVPTSNAMLTGLAGLTMMNIAGGRTIPSMVHLTYTAGLQDVKLNYPDLIDAIKKMAIMRIIEDAFVPSSGSISADGLSESMNFEMKNYQDAIDKKLDSLREAIHGIRMMVM